MASLRGALLHLRSYLMTSASLHIIILTVLLTLFLDFRVVDIPEEAKSNPQLFRAAGYFLFFGMFCALYVIGPFLHYMIVKRLCKNPTLLRTNLIETILLTLIGLYISYNITSGISSALRRMSSEQKDIFFQQFSYYW